MSWGLVITNPARRVLKRLPKPELRQINTVLGQMCDNPYHGDIRFLKGSNGGLRRRIGDWRIFYDLEPEHKMIIVTGIRRRGSMTQLRPNGNT
jgi:mRNA-degrading endonuclease RelE of RelBE toxin-antitoxin system